jgi:hypothetical protein
MPSQQTAVPITDSRRIELALADLTCAFEVDAQSRHAVEIRGGDPILRTRYRIGAGAIVSHLAVGLAASELGRIAAAPDGRIRYLGPVLSMSGTPPGTERPPVPLGSHPPEWPSQ